MKLINTKIAELVAYKYDGTNVTGLEAKVNGGNIEINMPNLSADPRFVMSYSQAEFMEKSVAELATNWMAKAYPLRKEELEKAGTLPAGLAMFKTELRGNEIVYSSHLDLNDVASKIVAKSAAYELLKTDNATIWRKYMAWRDAKDDPNRPESPLLMP